MTDSKNLSELEKALKCLIDLGQVSPKELDKHSSKNARELTFIIVKEHG